MSSNVIELGPHENMTVEQALDFVKREQPKEVVVLYVSQNNNFCTVSSGMDRKDALWLIESGREWVMGRLDD